MDLHDQFYIFLTLISHADKIIICSIDTKDMSLATSVSSYEFSTKALFGLQVTLSIYCDDIGLRNNREAMENSQGIL